MSSQHSLVVKGVGSGQPIVLVEKPGAVLTTGSQAGSNQHKDRSVVALAYVGCYLFRDGSLPPVGGGGR